MDVRPLVLAFLLLVLACPPARAHEAEPGPTHGDSIREVNFDFAAAVEQGDSGLASGYGDAGLTYLPLRWCGTRRTSDDTANQVYATALPQVKFVYAYASDQPDRFAEWADVLQANASLISRFYAQQSGGLRAPRFDLGTSCGADYVDIATVRLPNPRAFYADNMDRTAEAVEAALPRTAAGARNYVILGDKLAGGGLWGQGWLWLTDAKGTANEHNRGGVTSVIYVPQNHSAPTTEAGKDQGYWPEGFLHEMNHNFGAVQDGSPNSTQAGHCRDGRDVMCYADGGLSYNSGACPAITSFTTGFVQMLDCGRDDYFSPAPAVGSWLATHFNTFDSVFAGDCPALGNQCGGGVAPGVTGGPSVTGTPRTGQTLTANLGTWTGNPAISSQWEEEVSGVWQPYGAPDTATIALGAVNAGRRYRIRVTAAGAETVVARSHPTAAIATENRPAVEVRPSISGIAGTGETLTAHPGLWTQASTFTYYWYRVNASGGASLVSGVNGSSYALTASDAGYRIALVVRAVSSSGLHTDEQAVTATRAVVTLPTNTVLPAIGDAAKQGRTLSSTLGTWTSATSFVREWQREVGGAWTEIAGATGADYTLTAADVGTRVRVLVRALNGDGSRTAASAPSATVAPIAPPVNTTPPVATGDALEGQTLTAGQDTWTGSPVLTVAWERRVPDGDWVAIAGATGRSHVLTAADVGASVRAVVTAENEDGKATAASLPRGPVAALPPEATAPPAVTGEPRTGQLLSASTGTWLRATSFAYAWQRETSGAWAAIDGAVQSTYTPVSADAGRRLRVVVRATGPGGTTERESAPTQPVADPPVLQAPTTPSISGTVRRGSTLTASTGTWQNATDYAYAWQRQDAAGWTPIAGADQATYVPGAADVGRALRVVVTASNPNGTASAASAATAAVADAPVPTAVKAPVVTGTLYVGEALAVDQEWADATSLAYRWQVRAPGGDWTDAGSAATYVLQAQDADADVRVRVTATNAEGDTVAVSAARGPVDADPVNLTPPAITGTAQVGKALTASDGTWKRATKYAYAWERGSGAVWTPIAGADKSIYTPVAADTGRQLRVVVTAVGSRVSVIATSLPTGAVAVPPPAPVAPPQVTGEPYATGTLTVSGDDWTDEDATAVVWQRRVGDGAWTPIAGATARTYTLTAADVGAHVRAVVTATNASGSATQESPARGPIGPDPRNTPEPPTAETPPAEPQPLVPAPPAQTPPATLPQPPRTATISVSLRAGRMAAGKLVVTVTGTAATVKGSRLKLRAGTYGGRFCAGRACVTRKLKVKRGRIAATRVTLPAASGRIDVTLKPRRGAAAKGPLVLP